ESEHAQAAVQLRCDHGAARRRALLRRVRRQEAPPSEGRRRQVRRGDDLGQAERSARPGDHLVAELAAAGARPGADPGGPLLRADPGRVKDFLRRGATLVANDIDHLSPGLTAFASAMEEALGGKVQGNLYLSSRRRQGFGAHFDTHDVYAVHVEGTKTWHVYEGRATDPIAHPAFKTLGREHHEKAKGAKLMDVHMAPGDLLYLPRGQYHDALADEGGTV